MKEKEAIAIAKNIADSGLLNDASASFKATIDETTGFLKAPVTLARTGVQYYMGYELGLADRAFDKIGVFRSPEEVFSPDTIDSFENMVVTNNHPTDAVTVDNVKTLQMGQVSNIKPVGDNLVGVATITDADLIGEIKSGQDEVSVGYAHGLIESSGVFQGDEYEFAQVNIRGNHLAVVDAGRCGSACKLTIDQKGGKSMIITLDGSKFDVADENLAQAILNVMASKDQEMEKTKKEMEDVEEEKKKAMKEKDKAEAEKEAMSSDVLSKDALDALVIERAELIADVKSVLGDAAPSCSCPQEAMTAVVDHIFPDMKLEGKSMDYITAAYDMAIDKFKSSKDSMDNLQKDLIKDKEVVITRDAARNKYMSGMGLSVEV